MAILGIGIVTVLQLFQGGLRLAGANEDRTEEAMLAIGKMSEALIEKELKEGKTTGKEGGMEWIVEVTPHKKSENGKVGLHKVVVRVNPGRRSEGFTLTTLKSVINEKEILE